MTEFVVTGCAGLVGSEVVRLLKSRKRTVLGFARADVDLTDLDAIRAALDQAKPKHVIHCAAMTAVDRCETERALAWRTNVDASATIAAYAQQTNARLVYVSTDYVFDGRKGSYSEIDPISPLGVYAKSKAGGELATLTLCKSSIIARTAVPFGPWHGGRKDFVQWLRDELTAKRPVRIVRDQISNPTYVPNLAEMLVALVEGDAAGVVHTAGATTLDRYVFAQAVAAAFKLDGSLISAIDTSDLKQASPRPLDAGLDLTRARSLGLDPWPLDRSLAAMVGT